MQLYKTKEISLSRKVYYIGCGVIVEYNLGQMVAVLWKRVKEAFKKWRKGGKNIENIYEVMRFQEGIKILDGNRSIDIAIFKDGVLPTI